MTSNQIKFKTCSKCKRALPISKFNRNKSNTDGKRSACVLCTRKYDRELYKRNPRTQHLHNKTCSTFLGITVAEQVLSKVFKNVKTMPPNNPGYDFVCNHGKKIDVKSACPRKSNPSWTFHIKKNTTADYFLCIAFDNRESLMPLYLWLIPGADVNHKRSATISESTLPKWDKYKLDISKTLQCCESLK